MENTNKNKIIKYVLFSIFALLFISLLVFMFVIFRDQNKGKYNNIEPSDAVLSEIIVDTVTGNETVLTQDELNGLIEYKLQNSEYKSSNGDLIIKGVYFNFNDPSGKAKIYIPFTYCNISLAYSDDIDVNFEQEKERFAFSVANSKIGSLKIPDTLVMKKLNNHANGSVINSDGNKIYMDSTITPSKDNDKIKIEIEDIRLSNGKLIIKTKGMLKSIEEVIIEELF